MAGLRCSDCIFCSCFRDKKTGLVQALCSRGYTLANPLCEREPDMYFARDVRAFVPVVDPFGEMYLRTHNTCAQFEKRNTPLDESCLSENDERGNSRAGNVLGDAGAAGTAAGAAGAAGAAAGADAVVAAGTAAGGTREAGVATVSGSAGTEAASDAVSGVASAGVSRTPGTASTASAERATHTTCAGISSACKRSWLARVFSHRE